MSVTEDAQWNRAWETTTLVGVKDQVSHEPESFIDNLPLDSVGYGLTKLARPCLCPSTHTIPLAIRTFLAARNLSMLVDLLTS